MILKSLSDYSSPDWNKIKPPVIVGNIQAAKMIESKKNEIAKQQKKVNEKIRKILHNPSRNDPVYQSLQRIFKYKSPYNLDRKDKRRFDIRDLAYKRFLLGYPPRKNKDNSYGDAIHWEWIVQCSIDSKKDIVIVTRDGDFGIIDNKSVHLNDWLMQEFKERVSKQRKIKLVSSLSEGLKIIHAKITTDMEEEERRIIETLFEKDAPDWMK